MNYLKHATFVKTVVLASTALFLLWHHIYGFSTHFGFDDMHYAKLSYAFSQGDFKTSIDHYSHRWGFIFPVGWLYYLFGVSDVTSALVPMFMTLMTVWLVWSMSRAYSMLVRIWAIIFLITCEWVLFYSDKLMPDITVMFASTAIIYGYWSVIYNRLATWKGSAIIALSVFYGFVTKETIILVLPLLLLWLLLDIFYLKRNISFWRLTLLFGFVVFGMYFGYSFLQSGDAMFRLKAIASNSYFSACSYDVLPVIHLIKRIGYELWFNFIGNGIFFGIVFLLPQLFLRKAWSKESILNQEGFWLLNTLALLLLSNFMTSSPNAYTPLCLDIRHYLFVVPPLAIASGIGFERFLTSDSVSYRYMTLATALLLVGLSFIFKLGHLSQYLAICFVVVLNLIGKLNPKMHLPSIYYWISLFVILFYTPFASYQDAKSYNYQAQKALVLKHLDNYTGDKKLLIITNPVEKNIDEYLLGFDHKNINITTFKDLTDTLVSESDSIIMISNGMTNYLSNVQWEDLPEWVKTPDASMVKIDSLQKIDWYILNKSDLMNRMK